MFLHSRLSRESAFCAFHCVFILNVFILSDTNSSRPRNNKNDFLNEIRDLMQEPINIDIQQQNAQSRSAGFCTTIAYKLDALSEDARDRAMMRILEILREERHKDQA